MFNKKTHKHRQYCIFYYAHTSEISQNERSFTFCEKQENVMSKTQKTRFRKRNKISPKYHSLIHWLVLIVI